MWHECIRSMHSWRNAGPWCDCAGSQRRDEAGDKGLDTCLCQAFFFSFVHQGKIYPSQCALVEWFKKYGAYPDKETSMWRVRPHMVGHHQLTTVIHLDSDVQGAHLLPAVG